MHGHAMNMIWHYDKFIRNDILVMDWEINQFLLRYVKCNFATS